MAIKVRLKHSSVEAKAPVAADLLDGEIGLNINENSPAAYIKDSAGQIVKLAGAGSVTDEDAVKKSETASQNMVGDLTLGTDNITLDAGNGGITAQGKGEFGGTVSSESQFLAKGSYDSQDCFLVTNSNVSTATIFADGSAEFKGRVEIDSASGGDLYVSNGSDATNGVLLQSAGSVFYGDTTINPQGIWTSAASGISSTTGIYVGGIKNITDDNIKISLEPSGSAAFAGGITTEDNIIASRTLGTSACYVGRLNESETSVIFADGSATFAGSVESTVENAYSFRTNGGGLYANGTTGVSLLLKNTGAYPVGAWNDADNGKLQLGNGTSSSYDITLDGTDGSASFAGNIQATKPRSSTAGIDTGGLCINPPDTTHYYNFRVDEVDNNLRIDTIQGADKVKFGADGAASFAGTVDVGVAALEKYASLKNDGRATLLNGDNSQYVWINNVAGDGAIVVNNTNSSTASTAKAVITKDGSASFAGDVQVGLDASGALNSGLFFNKTGRVTAVSTPGTQPLWTGYTTGNTNNTSQILADGSASFGSLVDALQFIAEPNGGGFVASRNADDLTVWRAGSTTFDIGNPSTYTSEIMSDGRATFAQAVTVGSSAVPADNGFTALIDNAVASTASAFSANNLNANGYNYVGANGLGSGNITFFVMNNGDATFTGTVTATVVPPSDARFKENIEPAKPQLADVVALGGLLKNYDWNDQAPLNEEIRSQRQLGLIAQEAETVCPTIVKDIHRTKQGDVITPEEIIPAVYEDKVIPAEYKTIIVAPAKLGPKGKEIVPATTEEVLVTPEYTEQVLVTPEKVIPATYEELDDSYKGISSEALIMKLLGAVAELSAEVTALKAVKTANWQPGEVGL